MSLHALGRLPGGRREPRLAPLAVVSGLLHIAILAALVAALPPSLTGKRLFYAPVISVNLVGEPTTRETRARGVVEATAPLPAREAPPVVEKKPPPPPVKVAPKEPPRKVAPKEPPSKPAPKQVPAPATVKVPVEQVATLPRPPAPAPEAEDEQRAAQAVARVRERQATEAEAAAAIERLRVQRQAAEAIERVKQRLRAQAPGETRRAGTPDGPVTGPAKGGIAMASGMRETMLMDVRLRQYYDLIDAQVRDAWVVPPSVAKKDLVTLVVARIRRDGTLEKTWLEQSSGDDAYDQTAHAALAKAAPYPKLPPDLPDEALVVGFRFNWQQRAAGVGTR